MIIAPDILCQVEGQPFPPDSSFGCQTPLQIAPEALQPIDMAALAVAEGLAVVHQPMDVASCRHASIAGERVRADDGARLHSLPEQGQQGLGLYIGHHLGPHLPTPAEDPEDRLLGGASASLCALGPFPKPFVAPLPSQVGFVHLHGDREDRGNIPGHGLAHQEQGSQDPLPLQACLLGDHRRTLHQDEPAQQLTPLRGRQLEWQRPRYPLVPARGTTTFASPDAPALAVLTSRAPAVLSHATILPQVAVLGLYPSEILSYPRPGIPSTRVCLQVDLLVLYAAPQPLDEQVVGVPTLAVHANSDPMLSQDSSEGLAGELGALVTVEDLRHPLPEGFFQGLYAEVRVQSVGQLPVEHVPAVPVHDGYQVHETSGHGYVGDVRRPHLVGPGDRHSS